MELKDISLSRLLGGSSSVSSSSSFSSTSFALSSPAFGGASLGSCILMVSCVSAFSSTSCCPSSCCFCCPDCSSFCSDPIEGLREVAFSATGGTSEGLREGAFSFSFSSSASGPEGLRTPAGGTVRACTISNGDDPRLFVFCFVGYSTSLRLMAPVVSSSVGLISELLSLTAGIVSLLSSPPPPATDCLSESPAFLFFSAPRSFLPFIFLKAANALPMPSTFAPLPFCSASSLSRPSGTETKSMMLDMPWEPNALRMLLGMFIRLEASFRSHFSTSVWQDCSLNTFWSDSSQNV
mmetsp:Transcript_164334/g.527005  ORF Transcript_164334/g.527005 Transcript_164334/m.527005 type:complete len:294 (-) Transcript_164334:1788-2669(-)